MDKEKLLKAYEARKKEFIANMGKRDLQIKQREALEEKLQHERAELLNLQATRSIMEATGKIAREKARRLLETTVTTALQYIFGPNLSASIELGVSAGKSVADIYILTDMGNGKIVKKSPEDSCGGGIVDIVSIALRIAMKRLMKVNGPLILDEPGKHVSADYSVKLAEFLKYISAKFDTQIIFVTHNRDLESIADAGFDAHIVNGATVMKPIKEENTYDAKMHQS